MLTHECKDILKKLIRYKKQGIEFVSTFDLIKLYPEKKQGKIALKIEDIIAQLSKEEYVMAMAADNTFINIRLTYKGQKFSEYKIYEDIEYLSKSIIIPALVSILTSIVVIRLSSLL